MVEVSEDKDDRGKATAGQRMKELKPKQIVEALDRYIVGQQAAKRAAAVAIRNRWRRRQLPEQIRDEVGPANMILIGPTGVGKTEIARRLAGLVNAPFIKVEATKYTEVGYHGRDVESMVRDLLDIAIRIVRDEQTDVVREEAKRMAEEHLLDALIPPIPDAPGLDVEQGHTESDAAERRKRSREKLRAQLRAGELEERTVELTIEGKAPPVGMMATFGINRPRLVQEPHEAQGFGPAPHLNTSPGGRYNHFLSGCRR